MSTLQTSAQPINQTSFARAVRLGTESVLDATATVGQARADNLDMARRWFHAAESYIADSENERAILNGLRTMLTGFNLYL